jgi:hypothetical protein
MWRSSWRVVLALLAPLGIVACGVAGPSGPGPGRSSSVSVSLRSVPTTRSVTVTPGKARFGDCSHGDPGQDTSSTHGALGYPNGNCLTGKPGVIFQITITNTGIAANIEISGSAAVPSDGGTQWSLCNTGSHPAAACLRQGGTLPGINQYLVKNFSAVRSPDPAGLTDNPVCDTAFGSGGSCRAGEGQSRSEGLWVIGPSESTDTSTSWTVTITWTPVPP